MHVIMLWTCNNFWYLISKYMPWSAMALSTCWHETLSQDHQLPHHCLQQRCTMFLVSAHDDKCPAWVVGRKLVLMSLSYQVSLSCSEPRVAQCEHGLALSSVFGPAVCGECEICAWDGLGSMYMCWGWVGEYAYVQGMGWGVCICTCTFMLSSWYIISCPAPDTNQHMQAHAKLSIYAESLSSQRWPTYEDTLSALNKCNL
jgi:hypothetical protein